MKWPLVLAACALLMSTLADSSLEAVPGGTWIEPFAYAEVAVEQAASPAVEAPGILPVSAPAPPPPEPEPEPIAPPRAAYVTPPGALSDAQLERLIFCESGSHGRHEANTGNGFYGAVQWMRPTWNAAAARAGQPDWVGVSPNLAPAEIQDHVTRVWWASSNPATQWPVCSRRIGPP